MSGNQHRIHHSIPSILNAYERPLVIVLIFLEHFHKEDEYFLEQFPELATPDIFLLLKEEGLAIEYKNKITQIHPLLGFQLKKELGIFSKRKNHTKLFQDFYQIYTEKAKNSYQKLKIEDHQQKQELLKLIALDFANYQWLSIEGTSRSPDFIHLFKILTTYLFQLSKQNEVIHYCHEICMLLPDMENDMASPEIRLAFLKIKNFLAHALHNSGKHQEAVAIYKKGITWYKQWKLDQFELQELGRMYQNLGIIYRFLKDFKVSELFLEKALVIYKNIGDGESEVAIMLNHGNLLLEQNQFNKAIDIYNKIEAHFNELDRIYTLAEIYQNKGLAYRKLKAFSQAEENYRLALEVYENFEDKKGEAQIYQNIGVLKWDAKQYTFAIEYYKKALDIYIPLNSLLQQGRVYQNLGVVYKAQGNFEDSFSYYKKALNIFNHLDERLTSARVLFNIGVVKWKSGQLKESEQYFLKAKVIFEYFNDLNQLGNIFLNLGVLYKSLNNNEESRNSYLKALTMLKKTENFTSATQASINLGILAAGSDDITESNKHFREGLILAKLANDSYRAAIICKNLAKNLIQLNKLQEASMFIKTAHKALESFPSSKHHSEVIQLAGELFYVLKDKELQVISQG